MDKSTFSTLKCRFCQTMLGMSADRVLWNEAWPDLPNSFVWLQEIFSDRTVMSLKISAHVAYPFHARIFNFSKEYKTRLIKSGNSLLVILPVDTEKSEYLRDSDIGGP